LECHHGSRHYPFTNLEHFHVQRGFRRLLAIMHKRTVYPIHRSAAVHAEDDEVKFPVCQKLARPTTVDSVTETVGVVAV
jgi:hypothetical protein